MAPVKCVGCGREFRSQDLNPSCARCGSAVILSEEVRGRPSREQLEQEPPGVWRYRAFLPSIEPDLPVTLGEGGTPLLPARRLGAEVGVPNLLVKDESRNPTGSFIDRGCTVLVSMARLRGFGECTCVTTGNLGASLAAYCAKAGIGARITIDPSTDRGKLYQMLAYGARIEAPLSPDTRGRGSGSLPVDAGCPYLLEGEKTTGLEVIQDLKWATPDVIVVPVGTGGHLSMIWRAIEQLRRSGLVGPSRCRLVGVRLGGPKRPGQGSSQGRAPFTELEDSVPYFGREAEKAIRASGGESITTTPGETIAATGLLARTEGIFAEPASASVIASLRIAQERGCIRRDDVVVCIITGAGLKDTKAVSRMVKLARPVPVREDYSVARIQVGETKLALLKMLAPGGRYGYELWQSLSVGRRISTASVYQHLGELEALGLVRRAGVATARGRERIPYELTRKGEDLLRVAGEVERGA
jgi:threonine synthase